MKDQTLPQNWRLISLDELCEKRTGNRNPALQPNENFIYVDISSVDNSLKRIVAPKELMGSDAPSRARQIIRAGDVIVSTTRPNLNSVALVPDDLDDQICSTGFCVLRPCEELDSNYLFAYVQTLDFVEALSSLVNGAMYPAVTDKQVKAQYIPLPPLAEQRRIAAIIEAQMAEIDAARAAVQAQLDAAEKLASSYMREVFESDEAQGWERKTIQQLREAGTLIEHQDGNHGELHPKHSDFIQTGVKFVTAKHLGKDGCVNLLDAPCISDGQAASLRIGFAEASDILLAHNATVGRVALAPENCSPFVVGTSVTIYRVNPQVMSPEYLLYALQSGEFQNQLYDAMKQTTRNQVPITQQRRLSVIVPPIEVQEEIAAGMKHHFGVISLSRIALREQFNLINHLPAAAARQACRGEL